MAETYNVYFRVQGEGWTEVSSLQEALLWAIPAQTLGYAVTYEWRVDATNEYGTTEGDTWTFTSISFLPPLADGTSLDPVTGEVTGTPTGANNMVTIKKLVAASNNKMWYEDV